MKRVSNLRSEFFSHGLCTLTFVMAAYSFSSCNSSDDYDPVLDDISSKASVNDDANAETVLSRSATDPFADGTQHYKGEQITQNIPKIGDVTYTCMTSSFPYYFVAVTKKKYSSSEMDAVGYQQNPYAVTCYKLQEVADVMCKIGYDAIGEPHKALGFWVYDYEQEYSCLDSIKFVYPYLRIDGNGCFLDDVWVKENKYEYPWVRFYLEYCPKPASRADAKAELHFEDDIYYWRGWDKRLMFVRIVNEIMD